MVGELVKATLVGSKLTLEIDLDAKGQESSSGKMNLHFTSGGWGQLPVGMTQEIKAPLRYNLSIGTSARR